MLEIKGRAVARTSRSSRRLRTCKCEELEDVGACPVGVLDQPETPPALREGMQASRGGEYRLPVGPAGVYT